MTLSIASSQNEVIHSYKFMYMLRIEYARFIKNGKLSFLNLNVYDLGFHPLKFISLSVPARVYLYLFLAIANIMCIV